MTIRWDDERRTLSLSVRDLAEEEVHFGGVSALPARSRAELGRREHETLQTAREAEIESYRSELSVSWQTSRRGLTIQVSGRIDGAFHEDGALVLEEIKTVLVDRRGLAAIEADSYPGYKRQVQLYRYLLERGESADLTGPTEFRPRLTFVALPSREQRVVEVPYDDAECRAFVERRLDEIIDDLEELAEIRARRKALAPKLSFPFAETRRYQDELIAGIGAALTEGHDVMASAATGIGKTIASLLPALQHALARGGQVFVATSKTTQQAMFVETAKLLAGPDRPLKILVLTAKAKVCPQEVVLCHPEACPYAKDYGAKVESLKPMVTLLSEPVMDAAAFGRVSGEIEACPFELSLDAIRHADVIIGDYNYVFDPGATIRRLFAEDEPSEVVLIIDEAHNLVQRGAEYYSPKLSRSACADALAATRGAHDATMGRLRRLVQRLDALLLRIESGEEATLEEPEEAEAEPEGPLLLFDDPELVAKEKRRRRAQRARAPRAPKPAPRPARDLPRERLVDIDPSTLRTIRDAFDEAMVSYFVDRALGRRPALEEDPLVDVHRALHRLVTVLDMEGEEFSTLYSRGERFGGGFLKVLCKDPSGPLGRRMAACRRAIAISATLLPFDFHEALLGFPPDVRRLHFPSPFPAARRLVRVDRSMTLQYRRREAETPRIAEAIVTVAEGCRGNVLAAFPSYEFLRRTAGHVEDCLARSGAPCELILQEPGMSDAARIEVLERLGAFDPDQPAGPAPALLLAVQGGVFTEGVDYRGELCVGVVLVGPSLPRVSFERKLIQEHFEERYQKGFEYAYLNPGMNRAIQAAGRVHRRNDDRGVIVLLGSRFLAPGYARLLPGDWYEDDPRELVTRDLRADVERFWSGVGAGAGGADE